MEDAVYAEAIERARALIKAHREEGKCKEKERFNGVDPDDAPGVNIIGRTTKTFSDQLSFKDDDYQIEDTDDEVKETVIEKITCWDCDAVLEETRTTPDRKICRDDLVEQIASIKEGQKIAVVAEHDCEFYTDRPK